MKRFRKSHFFNKIFFSFIILITLFFTMTIGTTLYYTQQLQNSIMQKYGESLENTAEKFELTIVELFKTSSLLFSSDNLSELLFSEHPLNTENYYQLSGIQQLLVRFRSTKSFIRSVYIVDEVNNMIISQNGTSTVDEFFINIHQYDKYDRFFWTVVLKKTNDYKMLAPTAVRNNFTLTQNMVIPITQHSIENMYFAKPVVIDIDKKFVEDLLDESKLTPNSVIYMYDSENDYLYTSKPALNGKGDIVRQLMTQQQIQTTFKMDGQKYISYRYKLNEETSFTYCALVPYKELLNQAIQSMVIPGVVGFATIIFCIFIAFVLSNKLYQPVGTIMQLLEGQETENEHEKKNQPDLQFINEQINVIMMRNKQLTNNINVALPYVCERYLISALNDNKTVVLNENLGDFLSEYHFEFEYKYFTVVTTHLNFTKHFHQNFSKEDQFTIHNNILKGIKDIFAEEDSCYVVALGNHQVCSIINTEQRIEMNYWVEKYKKFHDELVIDTALIHLQTCIGLCHTDLQGLYQSYQESLQTYPNLEQRNKNVMIYSIDQATLDYYLTEDEEDQIVHLMTTGNSEKVLEQVEQIVNENKRQRVTEKALKSLFIKLYQLGLKEANRKHLSPYDLLGHDYQDVMSNIEFKSPESIYTYVKLFLKKIASLNQADKKERWAVEEIENYLRKTYKEDIYLDKVAEQFNVSSKYMSKIIKEKLGMSFHKYVAHLRMEEAKRLLLETEKTIEEISHSVGFNSRYPFMRTFKKIEGITPTEYRKYIELDSHIKET